MDETSPTSSVKWEDLSGAERLKVVRMAEEGRVPIARLCETFGMSRQTLHRARAKVREAAAAALAPKPRGRKPPPEHEARLSELKRENARLHKDVDQWKTKWEVARAFLELERAYDRGELDDASSSSGKKTKQRKPRRRLRRPTKKT